MRRLRPHPCERCSYPQRAATRSVVVTTSKPGKRDKQHREHLCEAHYEEHYVAELQRQRERYEARLVGRTIARVIWSNETVVGEPPTAEQVAGFELDGGEVVSFQASGQVDVDAVWLHVEGVE